MITEIAAVFKAASMLKSLAAMAGLVETMESRINDLVRAELGAGLQSLQQASISTGQQESLLQAGRSHFNKAIELEKGSRLVLAHIGAAVCHRALGDEPNAQAALLKALDVPPTRDLGARAGAMMDRVHGESRVEKLLGVLHPGFTPIKTGLKYLIQPDLREDEAKKQLRLMLVNNPDEVLLYQLQIGISRYLKRPYDPMIESIILEHFSDETSPYTSN